MPRRALFIGLVLAAGHAHADTPRKQPAAIEVDRDRAPAGRIGFGFDAGEAVDAWGASASIGWIEAPIRLDAGALATGAAATEPVRRRQTLTLGGALAVGDSAVLDLALRGSHQIGDRLRAAGDATRLARFAFHDLRLGGRVRVAGDDDRAALVRAELTLPTGDDDSFAGDKRYTAGLSLIGRATLPHDIVLAGTLGARLHGAEVGVGDRVIGDELFAAAGASVPVAPAIAVLGEILGALGDNVGDLEAPSPLEARIGAIVRPLPGLAIGAHVGAGLNDEIGAPRFRAMLEVAWTPRVARTPSMAEQGDLDDAPVAIPPQLQIKPAQSTPAP